MTSPDLSHLVFIGTYTHSTSEGIYVHSFDPDTGGLEPVSVVTGPTTRRSSRCTQAGGSSTPRLRSRSSRGNRRGRCTPTLWMPSRVS